LLAPAAHLAMLCFCFGIPAATGGWPDPKASL
jgi:hypothetical protein